MLETPIVLVMSHKEEIQEAKVKMKVGECIFHLSLAKFVGFSPGPWQMFFFCPWQTVLVYTELVGYKSNMTQGNMMREKN